MPSLIAYRIGKTKYEKKPDAADLVTLAKIDALSLPAGVPAIAFPFADMWEAPRMRDKGITYTHHMFLPRAALAMGRCGKAKRTLTPVFATSWCLWWNRPFQGCRSSTAMAPHIFHKLTVCWLASITSQLNILNAASNTY